MNYDFKQALNNVKNAGKESDEDGLFKKVKLNVRGSAIGLAAGLMVGFGFKFNIWVSAAVGVIAGGLIANSFSDNKDTKKNGKKD